MGRRQNSFFSEPFALLRLFYFDGTKWLETGSAFLTLAPRFVGVSRCSHSLVLPTIGQYQWKLLSFQVKPVGTKVMPSICQRVSESMGCSLSRDDHAYRWGDTYLCD